MAAAYKQSASVDQATSATTLAKAFASACTSGSLLVGVAFWNGATATGTFSDPTNGTWTAIGSPVQLATSGLMCQAFYFAGNTATTALTVTLTTSVSTTERCIAIHEYTGVNTLEQHVESYISAGTSPAQTLTPTNSSDLALTWVVCNGHVNAGPTGFTLRENTNFAGNGTADDVTPTGGTALTATWSVSAAGNVVGLVIFSQVTASSSTPTRTLLGVGA